MRIGIPKDCIDCVFNYDSIFCKLGRYVDGYGDTEDEGRPEHCKIESIELNYEIEPIHQEKAKEE